MLNAHQIRAAALQQAADAAADDAGLADYEAWLGEQGFDPSGLSEAAYMNLQEIFEEVNDLDDGVPPTLEEWTIMLGLTGPLTPEQTASLQDLLAWEYGGGDQAEDAATVAASHGRKTPAQKHAARLEVARRVAARQGR